MASNQTIAEMMDHLMKHYRSRGISEKAAAFSLASTAIRNLDKPVTAMTADEFKQKTNVEDIAIQKIREYLDTGTLSEFEKR